VLATALVACAKHPAPTGDAARLEARRLFDDQCSTCHGAEGKGDGPAARALNPKPRDYTDVAWQKGTTDAQLRLVIVKGGPAGGKSSLMPANPALAEEPEVLDAIISIVRGFAPHT
jgi:mono/diheme cytochrome c family protein